MLAVELIALVLAVPGALGACFDVFAQAHLARHASRRLPGTTELTITVRLHVRRTHTAAPSMSSRLV